MSVKIDFDPTKNAANIANHGVSLADAKLLEWDLLLAQEDIRDDYGEQRMVGYAPIGTLLFCVVFTEHEDTYRIISLRKATKREVREYASQI